MAIIKDLLDNLDVTVGYNEKRYTELYDVLHAFSTTPEDLAQRLNWPASGVVSMLTTLTSMGLVHHYESRGASGPMVVYAVIRAVDLDQTRVEYATRIVKAKLHLHEMSMHYTANYLVSI